MGRINVKENSSDEAGAKNFQLRYNTTGPNDAMYYRLVSNKCKQYIKYECLGASINNPIDMSKRMTWWTNWGDEEQMTYWGNVPYDPDSDVGPINYCECGLTHSCDNATLPCNCDANDLVWREDSGWLTYKQHLPIAGFYAGETGLCLLLVLYSKFIIHNLRS